MKYLLLCMFGIFGLTAGTAAAAPCELPGANESVLEAGAEGLGPGEWCELTSAQAEDGFFATPQFAESESDNVFEFAHGGQWDPLNRLFVLVGYGYPPVRCATIVYHEATNEWMTFDNEPVSCAGQGHAYDQTVVDPETGYVYYTPRLNNDVYRGIWNNSAKSYAWTQSAVSPIDRGCVDADGEEAMGMAWDTSRNGIVLFTDAGGGTACFWNESNNTWSRDGEDLPTEGSFHQTGEYDPISQVTWMQDYTSKIHYRNDGGDVTALSTTSPPFTLGCCGSGKRYTTADPVSGKFIVANADRDDPSTNLWYEFDINADSWAQITHSMPPIYQVGAGAPISDWGVIMYVDYKFSTSKVYLYKHRPFVRPLSPGDFEPQPEN